MINKKLSDKVISIAQKYKDIPRGRNKHFSFLVRKNKILSIGWNDYYKTHPECHKLGYIFSCIHSEFSAVLRYKGDKNELRHCKIVNVRVNSKSEIGISKPCPICDRLIKSLNIKEIYYTDNSGQFVKQIN